ncbi:MAG: signal peptidase I [Pelagibacterales bacterium]|nr:signal peptidase I [Pelagibacterales bacterium]PPR16386.1 MAG: Signal peptidase I [Alphaproteobacteria bacterium MarineAlpha9_Bin3]|tara:strand:+ start:5540 stop:6316 length:777 start_codon:yes stop_codon:yes gene_type:complete
MNFNPFKKKIKEGNSRSKSNYWIENIKTFSIAILIALTLRTFAFEPFSIPSGSMKPTLLEGDYLFVSKYSYGYSRHSFPMSFPNFKGRIFGKYPERGDVAVFKFTKNTKIDYIKRIVGLPGDKIQIKNGLLFINEKELERESLGLWSAKNVNNIMYTYDKYSEKISETVNYEILDASPNGMLDNTDVYTVPEGHFFALGDNRDQSSDSRILSQLGFIPFKNLVGKAQIIFYSRDRSEPLWKLWLWPSSIRVERLFKSI